MINKLFQITVVLILFLNVFDISLAEDDQNLASFIIRNYETAALPTVGRAAAS